MHEPPAGITDDDLIAALRAHYNLSVAELTFLPLGHDSSAWVYRAVADDGRPYFAKLRISLANPVGLLVPKHLHDHGVAAVVAPLATSAGELWASAGPYTLILYPFVAGDTGMARGMTAEQWRAYGAILRQIHQAPVGPALAEQLRRESFAPAGADTLRQLEATLDAGELPHAEARALAACWRANRAAIQTVLRRAEELGRRLAQAAPPALLCHADIHTNNLLVDPAGQVWIVDWDETLLAPRERDLMFVAGGISARFVGPREEGWFFEGYGAVAIDPLAMAYYRAAWAVGDIASFGADICFRPDLGPVSRQESLRLCVGLFEPGEIVSIALSSPVPGL